MQCHHITPQSDGGDDTFENCIPLCLECHGEVMAYNPKHPIGKMYTPEELKRRRDEWYESVTNAPTAVLDQRHMEIDRQLLARLRQRLPPQCAKAFFCDQSYRENFPRLVPALLQHLSAFGIEVESEFLDPTLEALFAEFRSSVDEMLKKSGIAQADTIDEQSLKFSENYPSNPSERHKYVQRRGKLVRRVEAAARSVYQAYANLVRECRRKLSVDLMSELMREQYYGREFIDPSKD